jgi:hypothetical protein
MKAFLAVGISIVVILIAFYFSVYCYGIRSDSYYETIDERGLNFFFLSPVIST